MPFEVKVPVLPIRGGEPVLRSLFEPLGYEIEATPTRDFGPTYGSVSVVRSDADTVTVELTDAISDELTQVRMRLADGTRLAR